MNTGQIKENIDILLVWPSVENNFSVNAPSLGLAYLAAVLEPDYTVGVLECQNEGLYEPQETVEYINKIKPRVVGFTLPTLCVPHAEAIIKALRQKDDCPVLLAGGPHASVLPEEMLSIGVDYVAIGEAEETIKELMAYIFGKPDAGPLNDIAAIAFELDGQVIKTKKRELLDVKTLPFPAWHYFNMDCYGGYVQKNKKCLPVMSSRGCPQSCTFCYKGIFGTSIRLRDAKSVVDEIQYLKDNFNIEEFSMLDENFTFSKQHVMDVCNLLIEREINLPWYLGNGVRVDSADEEAIALMKKAGCYRIALGVESGNEDILKELKKRITKDQVRHAVALYKKYGYEISPFFLIGAPSETYQTAMDTINFAIELNPDIMSLNLIMPFPGSQLFEHYNSAGLLLTKDWRQYNHFYQDRTPVFNHPNLTWEELKGLRAKAYRKFYFRFGFIASQIKKIKSFSDVKLLFKKIFILLGFMKSRL